MLNRHILGLGLALQDLDGHLARGVAQVLVVDGEGEQTAGLAHALLASHEGELVLLADLADLRGARGDGVVGGGVQRVDLAHGGLDDGLDLIGARDGEVGVVQAQLVELLLGGLDLDVGVGLGGAVEQADLLYVGQDLLHHLELLGDRGEVGGASDVGAGLIVVLDQARGSVVGDGAAHDGDIGGGASGGLRGGRSDGIDQVDAIAHELVGDGLTRGLVVLGVLLIDLDLETALLDGLDKAVVGGVECGVLGELQNADGVVGTGGSRAGTRVAAASGERSEREQASRDQKAPAADGDVLHIVTPKYRNGWKHCTQTKCKWNYSSADVHFYNNLAGFLIQNRMGGTGSRMDGGGSYAAEAASSSSRAAKSFLPSRRRVVTFLMRPISTVRSVSSAPRAS